MLLVKIRVGSRALPQSNMTLHIGLAFTSPGTVLTHNSLKFDIGSLFLKITRDFVSQIMHDFAPEGFHQRKPDVKKLPRTQLTSKGPHEEWCGDGHDKLNKIGVGIYGVRDKASGKWLGLWAIPNNRIKEVIAYLYLLLVEEYGGASSILGCLLL